MIEVSFSEVYNLLAAPKATDLDDGVVRFDEDSDIADTIGAALERRYREEFRSWNWDLARTSAEEVEGDDGDRYAVAYLGSVFNLTPSGKVYAFWTTNQTAWDVFRDCIWWEVLEAHLETLGAFVFTDDCGDGDGVRVAWHLGRADDDDDDGDDGDDDGEVRLD